jgi:hypothetical protein
MSGHAAHGGLWVIGGLIVAFLLLRGSAGLLRAFVKEVAKDSIRVLVWRHFTGAHYHGREITDASWWSRGTTVYRKNGRANTWEHMPRGHRALWRVGCTLAFFGMVYGLFAARTVTLHVLESLIVYGLVVAGFVIEARWRERLHRRHVLNPIIKSLSEPMRLSVHTVRRLVHIKAENLKQDEGEIGYIELPDRFTPSADLQATIARIVDAHLPVDTEIDWKMQESPKLAVIIAAQEPPGTVSWDEIIPAMETAAEGDIVLGKNRTKDIFQANFIHLDDPHWACSVNTKRGKSNFLGLVSVQVLHQDPMAQVICVDPKRSSLIDYLGSPITAPGLKPLLPGVTMANDPTRPEDMWRAVAKARKILEQRSKEVERDRTKKFPACLVIIDELNMFQEITHDEWAKYVAANKRLPKEEQEDLPKECPVWGDIRAILRTGRFVGVHMLAMAQDFRDDAIGGKGARNYFGMRAMGGFHQNQWKYFVGTTPVPVSQKGVGRWIFTQGEQQDWVQIAHADPDRAYAWAAHGRELYADDPIPAASVGGVHTVTSLPLSLPPAGTDGHAGSGAEEAQDERPVVGLDAASHYLGMTRSAFEKARQRTESDGRKNRLPGEFVVGRQPAWYASDLDDWKRNRPGSKE